jgi:hypothetical protein
MERYLVWIRIPSPNGELETEHSFGTKSGNVKVSLEWTTEMSPLVPKIPAPRKDTNIFHFTEAMIHDTSNFGIGIKVVVTSVEIQLCKHHSPSKCKNYFPASSLFLVQYGDIRIVCNGERTDGYPGDTNR